MNTSITYLYRDGQNFKYTDHVVVEGKVTFEDLAPFLDSGTGFCPADVGLVHPGEQAEGWYNAEFDHTWCELDKDSFEETDERPLDAGLTAEKFIQRFAEARDKGWPAQHEEHENVQAHDQSRQ